MAKRKTNPESAVMHEIQAALSGRLLLWRNNVGCAKTSRGFVRYGLGGKGGADLIGVELGTGRFAAVEVKAPGGELTPEQALYLDAVGAAGGLACVASSVEEARAGLWPKVGS